MALDIIGAGLGRTGTLSLKFALQRLGFDPCYHMMEVLMPGPRSAERTTQWEAITSGETPDWAVVFDGYRATVDWPACNYYRALMAAYPDAKLILSRRRDAAQWYASARATIMSDSLHGPPFTRAVIGAIVGADPADRDAAIAGYERHNAEVIASVPAERLLVYTPGDGWAPLCAFLGVAVPDEAYPHVNSTVDFQAMVAARGA